MKIKTSLVCVLIILLSTACRSQADAPNTAAVTPPGGESIQGSRAVYAGNLTPDFQSVLEQFPLASEYRIAVDIPENLSLPIEGHLEVDYHNQESVPLTEIIFRLFANYNGGEIVTSSVQVDQTAVETSLEASDTTLVLGLRQPLAAGEGVTISMDFSLTVPTEFGGNYGLLSYIDQILVLDLFYPMIPAYDQSGWYREYPSLAGDLSYNDIAFYQVAVSAPEDFILIASGSQLTRTVENGRQQVSFAAGPVRDFFLAGSSQLTLLSTQAGETTLNSYALPGNELHQQQVLDHLAAGMDIFGELFGPYPYTEFDVVSSPMQALGIEYPGVVGIFKDLYLENSPDYGSYSAALLEIVVAHELAHQWFYNVVGNDQQSLPWVDESITQYAVYLYYKNLYGGVQAEQRVSEWHGRLRPLKDAEQPLGMAVDGYTPADYSPIIYGRGPLFYDQMAEELGEETLLAALADYYQENMWQIATTESIRSSLEDACQCDLLDAFAEWVYP